MPLTTHGRHQWKGQKPIDLHDDGPLAAILSAQIESFSQYIQHFSGGTLHESYIHDVHDNRPNVRFIIPLYVE